MTSTDTTPIAPPASTTEQWQFLNPQEPCCESSDTAPAHSSAPSTDTATPVVVLAENTTTAIADSVANSPQQGGDDDDDDDSANNSNTSLQPLCGNSQEKAPTDALITWIPSYASESPESCQSNLTATTTSTVATLSPTTGLVQPEKSQSATKAATVSSGPTPETSINKEEIEALTEVSTAPDSTNVELSKDERHAMESEQLETPPDAIVSITGVDHQNVLRPSSLTLLMKQKTYPLEQAPTKKTHQEPRGHRHQNSLQGACSNRVLSSLMRTATFPIHEDDHGQQESCFHDDEDDFCENMEKLRRVLHEGTPGYETSPVTIKTNEQPHPSTSQPYDEKDEDAFVDQQLSPGRVHNLLHLMEKQETPQCPNPNTNLHPLGEQQSTTHAVVPVTPSTPLSLEVPSTGSSLVQSHWSYSPDDDNNDVVLNQVDEQHRTLSFSLVVVPSPLEQRKRNNSITSVDAVLHRTDHDDDNTTTTTALHEANSFCDSTHKRQDLESMSVSLTETVASMAMVVLDTLWECSATTTAQCGAEDGFLLEPCASSNEPTSNKVPRRNTKKKTNRNNKHVPSPLYPYSAQPIVFQQQS